MFSSIFSFTRSATVALLSSTPIPPSGCPLSCGFCFLRGGNASQVTFSMLFRLFPRFLCVLEPFALRMIIKSAHNKCEGSFCGQQLNRTIQLLEKYLFAMLAGSRLWLKVSTIGRLGEKSFLSTSAAINTSRTKHRVPQKRSERSMEINYKLFNIVFFSFIELLSC